MGQQLIQIKKMDRTVTVKASAEKEVKANFADWNITFFEDGDDLTKICEKLHAQQKDVRKFFEKYGFSSNDIHVGQYELTDIKVSKVTNAYARNQKSDSEPRFVVTSSLDLKTKNVDQLRHAYQNIIDLFKKNIHFYQKSTNGFNKSVGKPRYYLKNIETIKI